MKRKTKPQAVCRFDRFGICEKCGRVNVGIRAQVCPGNPKPQAVKPSPLTGKPCEDCAGTGKRRYDDETKKRVCTACEGTGDANAETDSQFVKPSQLPLKVGRGRVNPLDAVFYSVDVLNASGTLRVALVAGVGKDDAQAKAALIVRAVNAHAGLVLDMREQKRLALEIIAGIIAEYQNITAMSADDGGNWIEAIYDNAVTMRDDATAALRAAGEEV